MAIFNKSHNSTNSSEITTISVNASMEGEFHFNSMLHLDGKIIGKVHSENIVIIGKQGILKGELNADKVVVNGIFEGELEAVSLEILSGGLVSGNINTQQIIIELGGKINGNIKTKEKESIELIENSNQ